MGEGALRFSHSGERYILGYGQDFFGIWDRTVPGPAVLRFARTDQGWAEAWGQFVAREPRSMAVPAAGAPPPGVQAPGTPYRDAHALAQWTMWLVAASGAATLIALPFRLSELSALRRYVNGLGSITEVNDATDRARGIGVVGGLVTLAAIVVWLVWQYRARSNLDGLGAVGLRYSPGWAVGWWFIPVAFWWMPYLPCESCGSRAVPMQARRMGGAAAVAHRRSVVGRRLVRWVLGFVSGFTSRDPGQPMFQDTPSQMFHKVSWGVWADVALAAAAVLAFLVVREVDQRQQARRSRTQGGYGQTVAGV